MPERPKVIAFDVDRESLASLRQAFPDADIDVVQGASTDSLDHDWDPGTADLLVVAAHSQVAETLGLCRGLRSQAGRARTPILVLVGAAEQLLVRAALDAGADSCLVLPVHPKDLVNMLARAHRGNQPGRHTLDLERPQRRNPWQDEGGEG
jgi:DNA-binding response OmpR family regulator